MNSSKLWDEPQSKSNIVAHQLCKKILENLHVRPVTTQNKMQTAWKWKK